jgi:polysaccharide export outer membrane protein
MLKKTAVITAFFIILSALVSFAGDYVIGEGDVLKISVWGVQEMSLSQVVRPDGKITVPALGEVVASGLTPLELQKRLSNDLKKLIKNPVVTVIVEKITNNRIYVFGGGVKSGIYNIDRKTTLLQLLCQIGDLTNADLHNAYVERKGKKIKKDFYKLFIEGNTSEDINILPNDVVFIPAMTERNVYVVGAVNTPKFIVYRDGLTVLEAILDAGGFNKFAKENDVVIFRKVNGKETTINVRLKDLMKEGDLKQNIKLKPGDYIVAKEGIF